MSAFAHGAGSDANRSIHSDRAIEKTYEVDDHLNTEISVIIEGEGKEDFDRSPPTFEEYLAIRPPKRDQPVILNLNSHQSAAMYRTRLIGGVTKGPNFAGHYALVSWGCGNECQGVLVVDLNTGQVYSVQDESQPLQGSRGFDFRLESRLLIVDPPCLREDIPCVSQGNAERPVRYYLMESKGLRLVHKTPCRLRNGRQECG